VVAILVAGYASLPFLLHAGRIRPVAEQTLGRNLGRTVRIGSLRFSPTFGALIATDVSIADDPGFSSAPFLYAPRVDLSIRRLPLLLRSALEITRVSLEEPTVTLIHKTGQWNFHALLAAGSPAGDKAPGPSLRIRRGIVVVRASEPLEPFELRDVNLDAPRFSTALENAFALTAAVAGGGTLKLGGKWGPVQWQGRTPAIPVNLLMNANKVAIAESNLTEAIAPGADGLLSMDVTIEGDAATLQIKGNGEFDQLRLSANGSPAREVLPFAFALGHDFARHSGTLSRCDFTLGKGAASVAGTYLLSDDGATVKLAVEAHGVPVTPLSGLLPAAGVPLPPGSALQGGVAFIELSIEGNLKRPTTTGTVSFNNAKLTSFNLEERLSGVDGLDLLHVSRDLPIDEWRATVRVTPERITVSDLEVILPEVGVFTGQGAIDGNRTLDFRMSAVRHGVADKRPIPFVVRGACISPIFRPPGKTA
jgi:AsmA protein